MCIVGKYTSLKDSYLSITKAIQAASIASNIRIDVTWVESSDLEIATKEENSEKYDESWQMV